METLSEIPLRSVLGDRMMTSWKELVGEQKTRLARLGEKVLWWRSKGSSMRAKRESHLQPWDLA